MGGEFPVGRVQVRLVAAGRADPRPLVVRDHEFGHPPKSSNMRTCEAVESSIARLQVTSTYVVVDAASTPTKMTRVARLAGAPVHDRFGPL